MRSLFLKEWLFYDLLIGLFVLVCFLSQFKLERLWLLNLSNMNLVVVKGDCRLERLYICGLAKSVVSLVYTGEVLI